MDLSSVPDGVKLRYGFPRPDWAMISQLVDDIVAAQRRDELWIDDTWKQIARQWLEMLREAMPSEYVVLESPQFLSLVAANDPFRDRIPRWAEHYRRSVLEILGDVGCEKGYGKQVVLAFDNLDSFYSYISDFYPEVGEFAEAGGVFLDHGYGHIALWTPSQYDLERTIAHELTHAMLRHLPLPRWLDEGLTMFVADAAVGSSSFVMSSELAQRHRDYWNESTIDAFWSGESFYFPGDGQELSYSLAEVLFRNLNADFSICIRDFVKMANYADAGEQALVETCRAPLAERAAQFLGPGPWQPRTDYQCEVQETD